jgi:hypothetical protein
MSISMKIFLPNSGIALLSDSFSESAWQDRPQESSPSQLFPQIVVHSAVNFRVAMLRALATLVQFFI